MRCMWASAGVARLPLAASAQYASRCARRNWCRATLRFLTVSLWFPRSRCPSAGSEQWFASKFCRPAAVPPDHLGPPTHGMFASCSSPPPAADTTALFPRSCRLRQTKPNKEPALVCGLVHRSVSSRCGPNRSSFAQERRPQAEETSIDHLAQLFRNGLKTIARCGRSLRFPENVVLLWRREEIHTLAARCSARTRHVL
jgi:hypothetical protein